MAGENSIPFETIAKGKYSGYTAREDLVIRDPRTWETVWERTHSRQCPPPSAPTIDFGASMVIGVYKGQQSSGGHTIAVTAVRALPGGLEVAVSETAPGPNAMTTAALTQPYHLVRVARSDADVRFVR